MSEAKLGAHWNEISEAGSALRRVLSQWGGFSKDTKAGLHDNVPADINTATKVRQSRATQPRCTDVPDWVITSAVATHVFGIVTVLSLSAMVANWAPSRCNLGGRATHLLG